MKLLSTLLFCFFFTLIQAQTTTVTMNGMGDIRLGMKQAEVEKLLNQSLSLPHAHSKGKDYNQDTVHVTYKGLDADLIFDREYADEKKYRVTLWEIRSSSPQLRTKSGIVMADDKYRIISTYEGYVIDILPEYEDSNYTKKSRTRSSVWLHDDNGHVMVFYLRSDQDHRHECSLRRRRLNAAKPWP